MDSGRSLLGIALGIGAVVLAAVVAVVVGTSRSPVTYPAGSPEAAIQTYLRACGDADDETAYAAFSTAVHAQLAFADYQQLARDNRSYSADPNAPARSVYIDDVSLDGDRATVSLTVEEAWTNGGLARNVYRSRRLLRMVREAGAWKIDVPLIWLDPAPAPYPKGS